MGKVTEYEKLIDALKNSSLSAEWKAIVLESTGLAYRLGHADGKIEALSWAQEYMVTGVPPVTPEPVTVAPHAPADSAKCSDCGPGDTGTV